jgi:hypothetical protein
MQILEGSDFISSTGTVRRLVEANVQNTENNNSFFLSLITVKNRILTYYIVYINYDNNISTNTSLI